MRGCEWVVVWKDRDVKTVGSDTEWKAKTDKGTARNIRRWSKWKPINIFIQVPSWFTSFFPAGNSFWIIFSDAICENLKNWKFPKIVKFLSDTFSFDLWVNIVYLLSKNKVIREFSSLKKLFVQELSIQKSESAIPGTNINFYT